MKKENYDRSTYLCKIGALCTPECGCPHSQQNRCRDERVKLRIEHAAYVEGVSEHAQHHGPLGCEELDGVGGQEHA